MRLGSVVASLAVIHALSSGPARAAVCPSKSMTHEDIVDTVKAAQGCDRAMKVFEACEFGASGDVDLGAAVEKKCEADFWPD